QEAQEAQETVQIGGASCASCVLSCASCAPFPICCAKPSAAINQMIAYFTGSVFIIVMIKIIVIFGGVMGALAYLTWIERKVMARVQMRPGPTRVGPYGLLQPIADGLKFLFKEDVVPTNANRFLYIAAPVISLVPALLSFSVIPCGPWLQVTD